MKKKIILPITIAGVAIVALSAFTVIKSSAGYSGGTGSPADGGASGSCSSCHSGGTVTPGVTITASPAFGTGNTYTPNTTYTITIQGSGGYAKYGFDFEILNSQSATATAVNDFGTFSAAPAGEALNPPTTNWPYTDIMHTSPKTSGTFTVTWHAPASGTGYLYCAVLGANGNGSTNGDKVKLTSMTLTAASTLGIANTAENQISLNVFPNPANDNIHLTYTVVENGTVSVKLYNIEGALVADLLNEKQERGPQTLSAKLPVGLAKGMYFVKLSVNNKESVKKLMVE